MFKIVENIVYFFAFLDRRASQIEHGGPPVDHRPGLLLASLAAFWKLLKLYLTRIWHAFGCFCMRFRAETGLTAGLEGRGGRLGPYCLSGQRARLNRPEVDQWTLGDDFCNSLLTYLFKSLQEILFLTYFLLIYLNLLFFLYGFSWPRSWGSSKLQALDAVAAARKLLWAPPSYETRPLLRCRNRFL